MRDHTPKPSAPDQPALSLGQCVKGVGDEVSFGSVADVMIGDAVLRAERWISTRESCYETGRLSLSGAAIGSSRLCAQRHTTWVTVDETS